MNSVYVEGQSVISSCAMDTQQPALNVDQVKKLWTLHLIISTGSLKKAALQAKVSPSAVSQSLASLEKALGKRLVVRNRGSVSPTADAINLLREVQPAFEIFNRLGTRSGGPIPELAWLDFGTYESIAVQVLPGLVQRLKEVMPKLRLGLRISRTPNLLTMIRKGELCSALITEVDDLERFYVQVVGEDRLGFYVGRQSELAEHGWKAIERAGIGTLAFGKDGPPRYFSRFMRQVGNLKPALQSDSFEALRSVAAAGHIVAVLPERVARRNNDLLEIRPPGMAQDTRLGVHKLLLVGTSNCDRSEIDFLAVELKRLLS